MHRDAYFERSKFPTFKDRVTNSSGTTYLTTKGEVTLNCVVFYHGPLFVHFHHVALLCKDSRDIYHSLCYVTL